MDLIPQYNNLLGIVKIKDETLNILVQTQH